MHYIQYFYRYFNHTNVWRSACKGITKERPNYIYEFNWILFGNSIELRSYFTFVILSPCVWQELQLNRIKNDSNKSNRIGRLWSESKVGNTGKNEEVLEYSVWGGEVGPSTL